jgi:Fur family ferric uptake transcriptional regulator
MAETLGARATRQKRAVVELLDGIDEFTSAQDLHARLRDAGERVGLTTIYTQLRSLAEAGQVDSLRASSGEVLYRRCQSTNHHHHLVCRRCGRAIEIDAPEIETLAKRLGSRHGFHDVDHVLEITGICDRCDA